MTDLGDLFKAASQEKKKLKEEKENSLPVKAIKQLQKSLKENSVFGTPTLTIQEAIPQPQQQIAEPENLVAAAMVSLNDDTFQQPAPQPIDPNFVALQKKMQFLEQAIGRIAATGPGSGEVNLRYLDDIDRPTIFDMRFLRYNASTKKFEFAEVNPHDIVYTTHLVTTSSYTLDSDDYYVGVNYAGPTTITLPTTLVSSGRTVIIKDESGAAETNPITVVGTVDNDAGGFIIQINNGAIQMIYRDGWRII